MKVLIGEIAHETNTFSSVKTDEQSFRQYGWFVGEEVIKHYKGVRNALGGMMEQASSYGFDIIPSFATVAYPSGTITKDTFIKLKDELLKQMKLAADFDAIALNMHGAGVAETTEDIEGALLTEIRSVVGKDIPIVITLDLHANMTETMVNMADAIIGNHLYPHTDSFENGQEALHIIHSMLVEGVQPKMYLESIPMMTPPSTTNLSPAKDVNDKCYEWESHRDVIDCTFYHGFPYTDISHLGASVLVTTKDNPSLARQIAKEIGQFIWNRRNEFIIKHPNPKEGIRLALQEKAGPVVLNETSDNPGGGTPSDGTFLLREMIESNLEDACFGIIYDPETVKQAINAGIGKVIPVRIGGKTDSLHGEPIEAKAYVKTISDGTFIQSTPMNKGFQVNLGPSVRLICHGIDVVVVSSGRIQVYDEQVFLLHGIDVMQYKIIGLKSSQHFRAVFEAISKKIITVDSPGLTSLDMTSFKYEHVKNKLFPLFDVSYN